MNTAVLNLKLSILAARILTIEQKVLIRLLFLADEGLNFGDLKESTAARSQHVCSLDVYSGLNLTSSCRPDLKDM